MSEAADHSNKPSAWRTLGRSLLFLLLVITIFTFPHKTSVDLDSSWRIALGRFFLDGLQFGPEVAFTYGPLGFLMGRTYSGLMFWGFLAWQSVAAAGFALLIMRWGARLAPWPRLVFVAYFFIFGFYYEDALHMQMITLLGFELLRRIEDRAWRWSTSLLLLALAILALVKFTNLLLGAVMVGCVGGLALWRGQRGTAMRFAAWFGGGYLAGWVACGQNPLNLPVYLLNSWHVSQGYQEAMGITTPAAPFWKALVVIGALSGYLLLNLITLPDRPRIVAGSLMLAALIHLNWKHGFVRADGHMLGFFYCALLVVVSFPALLDDLAPHRLLKRCGLAAAGVLCVFGIYDTIPALLTEAHTIFQQRFRTQIHHFTHLSELYDEYDVHLARERALFDMPVTRKVIGGRSVDVIGHEQAAAVINGFNYRPRPVFQSYSAYTPALARLNAEHYLSENAPDFVLVRVDPIDGRLAAMDDAAVLYHLTQRYSYVLTERRFQLWEKNPAAEPLASPQPLRNAEVAVGEAWKLEPEDERQPLWIKFDLRPTLLGRLRTFLYKPPMLRLAVEDTAGRVSVYRMPAPIGRAGFIINPVIEDIAAFTYFANGKPERLARSVTLELDPPDRKFFAATARVELSKLAPSTAAREFFNPVNRLKFHMFAVAPIFLEGPSPPSAEHIDGRVVMVVHAPSEMVFNIPAGATKVSGWHGILAGAYAEPNNTNGAEFIITWSNGAQSAELYRRFLDPKRNSGDRGLKNFRLDIGHLPPGRLYFRILPGPYNDVSWDWTAWTGVDIK
jgi:hypothetical protein